MAAIVQVTVATTLMLLVNVVRADGSSNGALSCSPSKTTQVAVNKPGSVVKLQCPTTSYTLTPQCSPNLTEVFCDESCSEKKTLTDLCPGASGTQDSGNQKALTMNIPQLPPSTSSFYLKCTESGTTCMFAVTVSAAPPEGPQACAVKNTSVTLAITGKGGSTSFTCGSGLELNPKDPSKVYDHDCKKEKDLKDLTRSSAVNGYYTVNAKKTPKDQKICYLCGKADGKGLTADNCAVLIHVSGGSGLAVRSAFGLAVPCVLTLLLFT